MVELTPASIRSVYQLAGVSAESITEVGLTGQIQGQVLLDGAGNVLHPAILWNDKRTQMQYDGIHQRVGKERFIQITENEALTGFTTAAHTYGDSDHLRAVTSVADGRRTPGIIIAWSQVRHLAGLQLI